MLSSRLMANLISLVFQAIHFAMSGSMENSWRASELGAEQLFMSDKRGCPSLVEGRVIEIGFKPFGHGDGHPHHGTHTHEYSGDENRFQLKH